MNFPGAALVQELGGLTQLGAPNDGVVNEKQASVLDQLMDGDQLHFGDQVPLALNGGHERAGPGRRILDKGPREGNAGLVGVADGMGGAGIGHACHGVRVGVVPAGQHGSAVIPHFLHADPFVGRGGIAVIHPEEGADLHVFTGLDQRLHAFGSDNGNLAGAQLPLFGIAQVQIGKALKGNAVGVLLSANGHRGSAQLVPGCQNAFGRHDEHGHGAVDHVLGVLDALDEIGLLVDDRGHQLGGVHIAAAHFQKVGVSAFEQLFHDLVGVVDFSHSHNGVGAVVGTDNQGLGLVVGDAANAQTALHAGNVLVKLGPERGVFNVVDRTVKALFPVVDRHARPAGAKVRVVVRAEKEIEHAVLFGSDAKKSAHKKPPWKKEYTTLVFVTTPPIIAHPAGNYKQFGASFPFQTILSKVAQKSFAEMVLLIQNVKYAGKRK